MASYGRQALTQSGQPVQVAADSHPEWKTGGITLDWTTITAVTADTTLADGAIIKNGQKGLQFGTILAEITASGLYGPALTTATDGRQTLARGQVGILNETVLQSGYDQLVAVASDHPGVLTGGRVWHARIQAGGAGQPTFATLEAALPRLDYADL